MQRTSKREYISTAFSPSSSMTLLGQEWHTYLHTLGNQELGGWGFTGHKLRIYLEVYFLRGMRDDALCQGLKEDSWTHVV